MVAETTALGAAYAAGLAVGFWKDPEELRQNWNEDQRWEPQWSEEQRDEGYAGWQKAVTAHPGLGGRGVSDGRRRRRPRRTDDPRSAPSSRAARAARAWPREPPRRAGHRRRRGGRGGGARRRHPRPAGRAWSRRATSPSGTSSRSSKLIHGGLRYLEQLDFGLVREALRERSLILNRLAPHLARPVPFLYPLQHRVWERFYVGSGVLLYDTMGGRHGVPAHRHLTRRQALREFPVAAQGRAGRARSSTTTARSTTRGTR